MGVKKMKRITAILCTGALLAALLCGCGSTDAGQTMTKVRLNEVTHSVFYAPQYLAMELGYFADEGLDIELTNGGGADKVMTAVVTQQSDIGLAGPESCVYIYAQGKEDYPRVFAQLTKRDGSFLVGRSDEDFRWENLKGKTVIGGRAGGMPEMTLEYVMRKNGVVPNRDCVVDTSVQFNMMAGAFTGGQGDYVALFEPTATEVELAGQGHILCSIGTESGAVPYTAYFASQSYLDSHGEIIEAFCRALHRAMDYIATHTDREVAEAMLPQFPDTDLDVLEKVTARHRTIDAWNTPLTMEESALERLETIMTEAGVLEKADWVAFDALVDNHYAESTK